MCDVESCGSLCSRFCQISGKRDCQPQRTQSFLLNMDGKYCVFPHTAIIGVSLNLRTMFVVETKACLALDFGEKLLSFQCYVTNLRKGHS